MNRRLAAWFAVVMPALAATVSSAQDTTATLLGTLSDTSGAVLPGVTLSIRHVDTAQTRTVISDDSGRYRAPLLAPGRYEVTAQLWDSRRSSDPGSR